MLITKIFLVLLTVESSVTGLGTDKEIKRMYRAFLEDENLSDAVVEECDVKYEKVGCFSDNPNNRALPKLILSDRDKINWQPGEWEKYLKRLACRCAEASSGEGYNVFGLQFYGECWSGSNRPPLGSDSYRESKKCISFQYEKCQNNDPNECVGEAMTNYVYRIMEGGSGGGPPKA